MAAEALSTLNPRIPIVSQVVQTGAGAEFRVHVFRDDVLAGGTKQRAIGCLIEQSQAQEFVYAGPVNGFAQLALAVAARHYQRKATVVVAAQRDRSLHLLSSRAQDFGAKIITVRPPNRLKDVQAYAERYVNRRNRDEPAEVELLPFGLHCPAFINGLTDNLRAAVPPSLLVYGSATILASLSKLWPSTKFMVVQVGKTVWPDQLGVNSDGSKDFEAEKFVAPEKFWEPAEQQPPYPTVSTYDDKLWQFVLKHGQEGDFVWNVAADSQTTLTVEEQAEADTWVSSSPKARDNHQKRAESDGAPPAKQVRRLDP